MNKKAVLIYEDDYYRLLQIAGTPENIADAVRLLLNNRFEELDIALMSLPKIERELREIKEVLKNVKQIAEFLKKIY